MADRIVMNLNPALRVHGPSAWLGIALLSLLAAFTGCTGANAGEPAKTQRVVINGKTFTLELALDDKTRFKGLSDVESIAPDGGMLFVFPKPEVRSFVMRRCLIPIDIIFLSPTGRIVQMHKMQVEPYDTPEHELKRYSSRWPMQFAIELREGSIDMLKLREGDRIELPYEELIARAK